jgi:HSP20 family protein
MNKPANGRQNTCCSTNRGRLSGRQIERNQPMTTKTDTANTQAAVEQMANRRVYKPNVDIIELPDELQVLADMPGASADNIDIDYEQGKLVIHGVVTPRDGDRNQKAAAIVCEYGVGDFHREFQIGEGIDSEHISAEFTNGVLTLHMPKSKAQSMKKIEVRGG